MMQCWSLDPPAQWKAGSVGAERKPFYFDCADCGAKEPPIAGIISTDGTFSGIGLLAGNTPFVKPAMFCAPCFAKRLSPKADVAQVTTVDELADAMRAKG